MARYMEISKDLRYFKRYNKSNKISTRINACLMGRNMG